MAATGTEVSDVVAWVGLGAVALAYLVGGSIWRVKHPEDWLGDLRTAGIAALFAAPPIFMLVVWGAVHDEKVEGGFYDASAQVIPVLVLALLLDKALFASDSVSVWPGRIAAAYLLGSLVIGEGAALYALGQRSADITAALTIGTLLLAGLLLVMTGLERTASPSRQTQQRRD